MGLPSIDIAFKSTAAAAIGRSQKGTVGIILEDTAGTGAHQLTSVTQIPTTWGTVNQQYVKQAFEGYICPPKKVVVYVIDTENASESLTQALNYMAKQSIDYLVGMPDLESSEAATIASWVGTQRSNYHSVVKAVLPNTASDKEWIVNFTTAGIKTKDATYAAAGYCARIAGLLAGTPMTISVTFAALPEVSDITRLTAAGMDTAIDAGELILMHDGSKVKVARGVNSLTTTTQDKGAQFKKIKIVEAMDMIGHDIRVTAQDSYIGKYANSYDNKLLLISAIKGYLLSLENEGILEGGSSEVSIDVDAQNAYLTGIGVDTSELSEQQIKEYNTADKVFLKASIKILDTIEDITLNIAI